MNSISANLNIMIKASEKASKILIRDFGEVEKLQVSKKGPSDFVTNSDLKAEKIIIEELKKEGLWDEVMLSDLKYFEGSLKQINRVPDHIKNKFKTAFEVEPRFIVEAASRRQKWIDQAQSLNLYIANVDGKKLDITYRMAWYKGLKTTYYLRSMGATATEKSTVERSSLNAVQSNQEAQTASQAPSACSILDPDCEACQ